MSRVHLEQREGALVAVKTATDATEVARLHREARLLAVARLPGVVELVALHDEAEPVRLTTQAVGGGSLATAPPSRPERAIALVAAVATIVADLHDLGIVHGALDPSHVLLDDRGRPVLCGFGSAGLVGDPLPQRRSGAATTPPTLRPSRDVYALGRLLEHLTAATGPTATEGGGRARALRPVVPHRAIPALVAQATADDPTCRPSARAFADAVQKLAPAAGLGGDDHPAGHTATAALAPEGPPGGRSRRLVAAAVTASAVLGVVVLGVGRPSPPEPGSPRPIAAAPAPPAGPIEPRGAGGATGTPPESSTTDLTTPTTASSAPPAVLACDDVRQPVAPAAPAAPCTRSAPPPADGIIVGADRYAVGDPGDEVLVGDWRCDTSLDVTVVRPQTGDVYLFEHLPHPGDPTEVAPVQLAHLGPGSHLEAGPADPSGCPALVGRLADGSAIGIAVPDHLPPPPSNPEHP